MLKWLAGPGVKEGSKGISITSDPLATIHNKRRSKHVYSVNRMNPLYSGEEDPDGMGRDGARRRNEDGGSDGSRSPSYSNPSSSSGYGSNPTTLGSLEKDAEREETEEDGKPLHVTRTLLNSYAEIESLATRTDSIPAPVWPADPINPRTISSSPVLSRSHRTLLQVGEDTDTFPRKVGNVALQVQKLTEKDLRFDRKFVSKLEVGTKSDFLQSRDQRTKERRRDEKSFKRTDQRSSLRSEPLQMHRDIDRDSFRALKKNNYKPRRSFAGHSNLRRGEFSNRSSRTPKIISNSKYVKKILVNQEPSRSWPGSQRGYSDKTKTGVTYPAPGTGDDRCFSIRHQAMSPIGEEGERGHDSLVTHSLLQFTSFSPTQDSYEDGTEINEAGFGKEDMDQVINELSKAVMKSKGVSTLTRAVSRARSSQRSQQSVRSSIRRSFRHRSSRRKKPRSRTESLRQGAGIESMRDLWEKTGMKTNGRKLLIESEDEVNDGRVNLGYESDLSDVSIPIRNGRRKTVSQSSTASYESENRKPRLVRSDTGGSWELKGGGRRDGLDTVDLDRVSVEDESDSSAKHVRFSSRSKLNDSERLVYEKMPPTRWVSSNSSVWERYYGSAGIRDLHTTELGGFKRSSGENFGSGFTLDQMSSNLLRKNEQKKKRLKCFCNAFCVFLLLSTFLLVIVAVSVLLTRGKNHFGSM